MGDTPKISIITTVYNVEAYLERTVRSILAQTFTDFELLLVDDGSPRPFRRAVRRTCQNRRAHPCVPPGKRRPPPTPATPGWTTPGAITWALWILTM